MVDLDGAFVLDVGTGSGILAIAARLLGAARAVGLDNDPDAIHSARENLELNAGATGVELFVADLAHASLPPADVVTANLTGALLARAAPLLVGAVRPGGRLILSGILTAERDEVAAAFAGLRLLREAAEDEWVCLLLGR